jgi:hypothetical protein
MIRTGAAAVGGGAAAENAGCATTSADTAKREAAIRVNRAGVLGFRRTDMGRPLGATGPPGIGGGPAESARAVQVIG